ncbi:translocation and assembly module lipoprotein TamL [Chryseobacterium caseinilyticum]|uniref:BamA/TamA family outer membrane protein n=1 Tax=Chryseobacterium caseinilyticum TaxID=2771428 RepID=A0ABR8Z7Q6_9FLAO|nr:BamA/TamA family outer membrane protein [Chryseobacterium caseinilyticum]MBD8081338.1 BamA/TamA family outer membrane protein [Chryseobacterium caseinilyticum]
MSCKHYKKSPQKYYKILSFATFIILLYACSTTKKVPDGEYLLTSNTFEFEDGKQPFDDELKDYVQQKPNKKQLLFVPLSLWFYNAANPKYDTVLNEYMTYPSEMRNQKLRDSLFIKYNMQSSVGKSLFMDRLYHNWGSPPVIFDETRTEKSAESIEKRLTYRGFWDGEVIASDKKDSTNKKASVNYTIKHNSPTIIKDYYYNIPDLAIKSHFKDNISKTTIKKGDILDQTNLEKEVTRINEIMRSRGYYRFNSANNEVYFVADSLKSRKEVPLTLEIHKDSVNTPYKVATIGNIDVAVVDDISDYYEKRTTQDSLRRIRFHKMDNRYKNQALWRAVIEDNKSVYDQKKLNLTKRNFLAMNNFSVLKSEVDYRKDDGGKISDSIIDVLYILKPLDKFELKLGTDINYSQLLNLGISPSVDLTTRNIFGGAENLTTSLSGTFGRIVNPRDISKRIGAYEISAQASLQFPRLLLPFSYYKLIPKRYTPTSSIVLGASVQNNIGLGRVNFNTGLNYFANVNDQVSHRLSLFNTQFSLTKNKDSYYDFFVGDDNIRRAAFDDYFVYNPQLGQQFYAGQLTRDQVSMMILQDEGYVNTLNQEQADRLLSFSGTLVNKDRQTQDVIISSMIYNFVYNEIGKKDYPNAFYFNGKVELAGNIPSIFNQKRDEGGVVTSPQKTIFGIPYAQFVKFDFDVRKYFKVNGNQTLALRQFVGVGIPYGNSSSMPFIRSYFNGGSNDIRAWVAFGGLGPGDSQIDERVRTYLMGNVKLTTNIEYRLPFNDMYEGAIFTDIGNIWNLEDSGFDDQFKFNKFIRQMGVGSGLGLRVNIAYITLRLDLAYKMYDPNKPDAERWRLKYFQPLKPTMNIAFGYPF